MHEAKLFAFVSRYRVRLRCCFLRMASVPKREVFVILQPIPRPLPKGKGRTFYRVFCIKKIRNGRPCF